MSRIVWLGTMPLYGVLNEMDCTDRLLMQKHEHHIVSAVQNLLETGYKPWSNTVKHTTHTNQMPEVITAGENSRSFEHIRLKMSSARHMKHNAVIWLSVSCSDNSCPQIPKFLQSAPQRMLQRPSISAPKGICRRWQSLLQ